MFRIRPMKIYKNSTQGSVQYEEIKQTEILKKQEDEIKQNEMKILDENVDENIKKYRKLLLDSVVDLTTNSKIFFTEKDIDFEIPIGTTEINISLVGGGGAGGYGISKNNLFYSGGGGGSGYGYVRVPVAVKETDNIKISCIVGKGGNRSNPDGGTTIVNIFNHSTQIGNITVGGGKRGGNGETNHGGMGAEGHLIYRATNGSKGTVILANGIPYGGDGGISTFFPGGRGMTYHIQDKNICNGRWGSGGGGSIPGIETHNIFTGGDGFVLVEYN